MRKMMANVQRHLVYGSFCFMMILCNLFVESHSEPKTLKILELMRIDNKTLRMTLDMSIGSTALPVLIVKVDQTEYSMEGIRTDDTNCVFDVDIEFDLFCSDRKLECLFLAQEESELTFVGQALFYCSDMDARLVSVVGAEQEVDGAYLRVSCGHLDNIEVGGKTCSNSSSPCYFRRRSSGSSGNDDDIKWCTSIANEVATGGEKVSICTDQVTPFEEIPEEEAPTLFLIDGKNLYLSYQVSQPSVEVLALDPVDKSMLSNKTAFNCEIVDGNEHGCSMQVDISDDQRDVDFLVVYASEESYTNTSNIYLFETFQIHVEYLTDGAVYLSWTADKLSEFSVIATKGLDFNKIKFHLSVICGRGRDLRNEDPCHAYFVRLENGDVVSIMKEGTKTGVAFTVALPDSSSFF